jgi:hypothetical protein
MKKIEQAKKYLNKKVYTASDFDTHGKYKIETLIIGGVNLYFNQVDYDVIGFYLVDWGDVKKENIVDKFDESKDYKDNYFYSREEAEKYMAWLKKDEIAKEKERDLEQAKELLKKHKVEFEIFN